jgi:hypothetical protein
VIGYIAGAASSKLGFTHALLVRVHVRRDGIVERDTITARLPIRTGVSTSWLIDHRARHPDRTSAGAVQR